MRRRRFLGAALAGLGGLLPACGGGDGGAGPMMGPPPATTGTSLAEGLALRSLATLANASTTPGVFSASLVASAAPISLMPGRLTAMWLYNGEFPGPLLEAREGDRVRVVLDNRLPIDTTVHWHGLAVPPDQDGSPLDPVRPLASRVYEFDLPAGSAGTYWYHPHAHETTAEQVSHGLAAPLIVRAAGDPLAHLPEVTLFVTGIRLDALAQVAPIDSMDRTVGRQGEILLVNGGRIPVASVRPGATLRWRIVNATSARHLRLSLEGHTLTLVGTDGGLLAAPVPGLSEITVAPAQRVEVIVNASPAPGARFRLRSLSYVSDTMGLGAHGEEDLLTLATTNEAPAAPAAIPAVLRPMADIGSTTATKRVVLSGGGMGMMGGGMMGFFINGRTFDPGRIDLVSTVGDVESWTIVNDTFMDHPIHIHGTQFQLMSRERSGVISPAPYPAWRDTIDVPAGQSATIKVRQGLAGKRMVHCHILEHEDAGMMAVLDVRPR